MVLPDTQEARTCVRECRKIQPMEYQLTVQKRQTEVIEEKNSCREYIGWRAQRDCKRNKIISSLASSPMDSDLVNRSADINHTLCLQDCGVTYVNAETGEPTPTRKQMEK